MTTGGVLPLRMPCSVLPAADFALGHVDVNANPDPEPREALKSK